MKDLYCFLEEVSAKYGDRIAVRERSASGETMEYTFRQLREDVLRTASALKAFGYDGKNIVVMGENCYRWVVVFWAVTISGGIAVPFDKEMPEEDIRSQIATCNADAVFCSARFFKNIAFLEKETEIRLFCFGEAEPGENSLEKFLEQYAPAGEASFESMVKTPDQVAAILFTSGTSGGHKAVMLTHRNICTNVDGIRKLAFASTKSKELVSILPIHHCYELFCHVFTSFIIGNTMNFCDSMRNFFRDIRVYKPDIIPIVPAFLEFIFRQKDALGDYAPVFMVGGATPNKKLLIELGKSGIHIMSGYGLTETSPLLTVSTGDVSSEASVGTVMPYVDIRVDEPNEDGVGEILVKGPNVSPGYYNDEEANRISFTKDGWFRTGDIGFLKDKNRLFLTGRKKNTIILENGKNVQPEEIETKARALLPYVEELVVCPMQINAGGKTRSVIGMVVYSSDPDFEEKYGSTLFADVRKLNQSLVTYSRLTCYAVSPDPLPKNALQKLVRADASGLAESLALVFLQ